MSEAEFTEKQRARLLEMLKRPPEPASIDTVQKARAFKQAHADATKFTKTWRGGLPSLQSHINQLSQYIRN